MFMFRGVELKNEIDGADIVRTKSNKNRFVWPHSSLMTINKDLIKQYEIRSNKTDLTC